MNATIVPRDRLLGLLQGIVAVAVGVAIVVAPAPTVGAFAVALAVVVCVVTPKKAFLALGAFLLLQDLMVAVAEQSSEQAAQLLRNVDEGLIMLLVASVFLRRTGAAHSIAWPLVALVAAGAASTFLGDAALGPAVLAVLLMVKGFLLFMACVRLDVDARDVRTFLRWVAIAGVALMASVALNYAAPALQEMLGLGNVQYRFGIRSAQGILAHPGAFGQVTAFLTLYSLALYWARRDKTTLVLSVLFGLGLLMSLRLRLVLEIPVTLMLGPIFLGARRRGIFVAIGLVFAAATIPTGLVSSLLEEKADELEGGARIALMETSVEIAKDNFPFGTGFGTYGGFVSSLYYSPVYYEYGLDEVYGLSPDTGSFIPDNYWAHILGETGALGAAAYALILFQILRALRTVARSNVDPTVTGLAAGAVLVLLLAVFEGFTSPVFQASLNVYLTLPAAAIAIAAWHRETALGRAGAGATEDSSRPDRAAGRPVA